jgi:hypothetical protein
MNGFAGLPLSKKRRRESITLSGFAKKSSRENAGHVVGPAARIGDTKVGGEINELFKNILHQRSDAF